QPIDEVLKDVDKLIQGFDRSPAIQPSPVAQPQPSPYPSRVAPLVSPPRPQPNDKDAGSFRYEKALKPSNLINEPAPAKLGAGVTGGGSGSSSENFQDFTLEQLLERVDPFGEPTKVKLLRDPNGKPELSESSLLASEPSSSSSGVESGDKILETPNLYEQENAQLELEVDVEPYFVLGDEVDEELQHKIEEAISETKKASGGTGNPYVTRSVFKATAYCNRVLGRLNLPNYKRYRRDILISLVRMHERNGAWVDAAKTYERFLEEFASDEKYPFEEYMSAPGISELRSDLGDSGAWVRGIKRGAPTIPETHFRLGKLYRKLGAHQMANNKFYDAMNSTMVLAEVPSDNPDKDYSSRQTRHDAVAKQAMVEIAATYLDAEDYDGSIKFYGRIIRVEDMDDSDRAEVLFKHALSHYRRARENIKKEEKMSANSSVQPQYKLENLPKADFAQVKLDLRGFSQSFPGSQYVPEAHYVLALTYDKLDERKKAIVELLALLQGAPFRPEKIEQEARSKPAKDLDYNELARMKGLWIYWKKKTGNYLANKFFEEGDYHSSLRVYEAMREIDMSPDWRVPVLYQIALCQEKLGLYIQAVETYQEVRDEVNQGSATAAKRVVENKYLKYVFGMAKWRREQLEDTRSIRQSANRLGVKSG
ncbi:MAG: tetratricopeptide repeat protein, partial [Opitutales bacterium]|nr:tetratricopeptide repeat protein [Opitutales bacterium]